MINTFVAAAFWVLIVLLVGALPLWIVAVWRKQWAVARGFALAAGAIALLFGGIAVSAEASVEACDASGGLACADAYMGLFFLLLIGIAAYVLVALATAIVIGLRTTKTDKQHTAEHLWCENCVDLVTVAGHATAHTLRPMKVT